MQGGRTMPRRLAIGFLLGCAALGSVPARPADLKPASRMAILRGLVAESGTVLTPLPRGQKGLRVSPDGGIDRDGLVHELTQQGTAIPSNTVVQITQIAFPDQEIVVEIHGVR